MGVMRAGLAVVILALLVGAEHLDEENLQSLESSTTKEDISDDAELIGETKKVKSGLQETGLKEFEDHAEMNLQQTDMSPIQEETLKSSKENTTEGVEQEDSTAKLKEPLLLPLANKTKGSSTEVITESFHSDLPLNNENPIDTLKEVTTKKSSEYKKLSVPKKGADPESVTPSVFARKGVGAEHLESSFSAQKEVDPKINEDGKGGTVAFSGTDVEAIPEKDIDDFPIYDENHSSPWKEITPKKSSSVPREKMEEFKKPSVAPKKDVDPNSSTPPVFAREDVNSDVQQSSVSELKDLKNIEESNGETRAYPDHLPVPQPSVSISEQKNNLGATSNDATSFSSDHSSTATETASTILVSSKSHCGHKGNLFQEEDDSKPDSTSSKSEGRLSPGVVLVLMVLVTFVFTVIVGFVKMSGFEGIPREKMDSAAQHGEDIYF